MIKSIDNSSANNVSNSLLGWSVAAPTNDSSSDDDGINGIHQAQLHQKKHSNTGEDDTEPSTLRTEYILHSSAYSNPSQTQLHQLQHLRSLPAESPIDNPHTSRGKKPSF